MGGGASKSTNPGKKRGRKYYWDYDSDIKKSGFGMMFRSGIGSNINCHLMDWNRMWMDTSFPSVKFSVSSGSASEFFDVAVRGASNGSPKCRVIYKHMKIDSDFLELMESRTQERRLGLGQSTSASLHKCKCMEQSKTKVWWWTPYKPGSMKDHDDWALTTTSEVKSGFAKLLQKAGMTDVAAENKFLAKLLADYNPGTGGSRRGSNAAKLDAKYDMRLCMKRANLKDGEKCAVRKSACLKNIVTRYFQFVEVQKKAVEARKARLNWILDAVSFGMDLLGLLPEPVGPIFDLLNAGLCFGRGHYLEGALSVFSALPIAGWLFGGMKIAMKTGKLVIGKAAKLLGKAFKAGGKLAGLGKQMMELAAKGARAAWDGLKRVWKLLVDAGGFLVKAFKQSKVYGKLAKASSKSSVYKAIKKIGEMGVSAGKWALGQCKSKTTDVAVNMLSVLGSFMEYSAIGSPVNIKEAGEWILAVTGCIELACGKPDNKLKAQQDCMVEFGSEVFKKVMPELATCIGEHDPSVQMEVPEISDADLEKARKEVGLEGFQVQCVPDTVHLSNRGVQKVVESPKIIEKKWTPIGQDGQPFDNPDCKKIFSDLKEGKVMSSMGENGMLVDNGEGLIDADGEGMIRIGVLKHKKSEEKSSEEAPEKEENPVEINHGTSREEEKEDALKCDHRRYSGLYADEHGTCEKDTGAADACEGGFFISRYCKSSPSDVRCCMKIPCKGMAGTCVDTRRQDACPMADTVSGKCKGPSYVKCCPQESRFD